MTNYKYLPDIQSDDFINFIKKGDWEEVIKYLENLEFERVGLDRVVTILKDIYENYYRTDKFKFLDIGCNNGMIAFVLACMGNRATGVDNFAIDTQQVYEKLKFLNQENSSNTNFINKDISDFLKDNNEQFDFTLLLSVTHQWEFGYAHSGEMKKDNEEIKKIIDNIINITNKAIYYECPVNEPGFEVNYGIKFLYKYLDKKSNVKITKIANTTASNGYIRELYRIEKIDDEIHDDNILEDNYKIMSNFNNNNGIDGEIVINGETSKTRYSILSGDYIYLSTKGTRRSNSHPMGEQNNINDIDEIWSKLKKHPCNNIMHIEDVYDNIAKVKIVDGCPLFDVETTPEWQKNRMISKNIQQVMPQYEFTKAVKWLSGLSNGLNYLHKLDIAHGDPYPFNCIVEDEKAVWIDLGNVSDDISQIYKDIYGFLFYNVFFVLNNCDGWSKSLIDELIEITVESKDVKTICGQWVSILDKERNDIDFNTTFDDKVSYIHHNMSKKQMFGNDDKQIKYFREFQYSGLFHYYKEFISWYKNSNSLYRFTNILKGYGELNNFEAHRLMVPKGKFYEVESKFNNKINILLNENKILKENEEELKKISEHLEVKINNLLYRLEDVNKSNTYKVAKFFRIILTEFRSLSLKRILILIRQLLKYLVGKKDAMYRYAITDPIIKIIDELKNLNNQGQYIENNQINKNQGKIITKNTNNEKNINDDEYSIFKQCEMLRNLRGEYVVSPKGKRVVYFTNQLLDWFDQRPRYGGGERYCITLVDLLISYGFEVDIYQIAPTEFEGDYHGYHVKTIKHGEFYSEFNIDGANEFYNISLDYDYVIYNMPELSAAKMRKDAISICHGIWFDHNNYGDSYKFRKNKWFKYLFKAFDNPNKIVSVDTNSINVIRSFWPELSPKMTFIPNFVDQKNFYPPREKRSNKKLKILFPRRSQINRGSRILEDILNMVPYDVDFYWVGEGDDQDSQIIKDLCKIDNRLHYKKAKFDEMPEWYRKVDVVVIPTIACEGTSLSCIEALASGCATISTNVGGLTDIIQDKINGRLVDPTPKAISEAINEIILNPELMHYYQEQGYKSSTNFSLDNWKARWVDVFEQLGWINDNNVNIKYENNDHIVLNICIITKNGYHGGVESLIKLESEKLNADVIVAGGLNNPENTCPFKYEYINCYEKLVEKIQQYDVVVYHWLHDWAVQAVKDSGIPSLEFVHRTDTSECDKTVPTKIVSHSKYVCKYIKENFKRECGLVPNVVNTEYFLPSTKAKDGRVIGSVTSYYKTKGIDILIEAWSKIQNKYPDHTLKLFGSGTELDLFKTKAKALNCNIEFNGPVKTSLEVFNEISLMVSAARIEGLPIVMLEAISCNVPIIASDIDGHKIINKLSKDGGYEEPIILFESQNADSLAQTLDKYLSSSHSTNIRNIATDVFSPDRHINGLKKYIMSAYDEKEMIKPKEYKIIDTITNNGQMIDNMYNNEGFSIYDSIALETIECDTFNSFEINFDKFAIYHCSIPTKTLKISSSINCFLKDYASIYIQYNFYDANNELIDMVGEGKYIDTNIDSIYFMKDIPYNESSQISRLEIVVRPDEGKVINIKSIKVDFWSLNI